MNQSFTENLIMQPGSIRLFVYYHHGHYAIAFGFSAFSVDQMADAVPPYFAVGCLFMLFHIYSHILLKLEHTQAY